MEAVVERFRTSLGGFNRQDVKQYVTQTAAAHQREVAELEERLAQAESERDRLERTLSGLEDERGSMETEKARVRASLEESTAALTRMRGELSQTETRLITAKRELERLQAQVSELAPMAKSYAELKDRVATVELDAHRKAQATIDEARRQAEELRAQTQTWLKDVLAQYAAMRQGTDAILEQAEALSRLREQAAQTDEQAGQLRERGGLA